MGLLFRLAVVLLRARVAPRASAGAASVLALRVLPTDLDVNLHMNNGRYLSVMDLGRFDLLARMGVLGAMRRERWGAVVGGITVRFRRPLSPFERYTLTTRLVCWDAKWFHLEQHFDAAGERVADARVRGALIGRGGVVPPAVVLRSVGELADSPPCPPEVVALQEAEGALRDASARSRGGA